MNYVPTNPNQPCCDSCGEPGPVESFVLYRLELICPTCKADHDMATAQEKAWDEFEERNRALTAEEQRD